MQANPQVDSSRYAKVIEVSRRVRWEIERDLRFRKHIRFRCWDCA